MPTTRRDVSPWKSIAMKRAIEAKKNSPKAENAIQEGPKRLGPDFPSQGDFAAGRKLQQQQINSQQSSPKPPLSDNILGAIDKTKGTNYNTPKAAALESLVEKKYGNKVNPVVVYPPKNTMKENLPKPVVTAKSKALRSMMRESRKGRIK